MKYWAITDKGLVRKQNEDAYFACCNECDGFALFVVCDGMGGAQSGNIASNMACEAFVDKLNSFEMQDKTYDELSGFLYEAAEAANTAVYEKSIDDVNCAGMGTTLVAALVHGSKALIINIGDSRAYYISGNSITQITVDHSVVEDMVSPRRYYKGRSPCTPEEKSDYKGARYSPGNRTGYFFH